ncbi:Chitin synthase, class 2 [Mucor velutinosus]|uniref:Chitin synthase, class 2 n=1 Tax=Mucor velutinosus TaxID=708070 RepID=A0AAN7DRX8_9FUNG|nr:Chitin synthase, class 2 [Mucor velutinosus]
MKYTSILALTASAMLVLVDNGMAAPTGNDLGHTEGKGSFRNVTAAKDGGDKSSRESSSGDDHSEKGFYGKGRDGKSVVVSKDKSGDGHSLEGYDDMSASAVVDDCDEILESEDAVAKGDDSENGSVKASQGGNDSGDGRSDKGSGGDHSDKYSGEGQSGKGSHVKGESSDDHGPKGTGDKTKFDITDDGTVALKPKGVVVKGDDSGQDSHGGKGSSDGYIGKSSGDGYTGEGSSDGYTGKGSGDHSTIIVGTEDTK